MRFARHITPSTFFILGTLPYFTIMMVSINKVRRIAHGNTFNGLMVNQCQEEFAYTIVGNEIIKIVTTMMPRILCFIELPHFFI